MKRLIAYFQELLRNRPVLLAVTAIGLLALFALAAGLNNLDLAPAVHFVSPEENNNTTFLLEQLSQITLIQQMLLAAMLIVTFAIILVFLDPESRKRVLKALLRFASLMALFFFVLQRREEVDLALPASEAAAGPEVIREVVGTEAVFTETPAPPWFTYIITLVLLIGLPLLGWWLWKRSRRPTPSLELDEVAAIARETLDDLAAGRDWHDTIISCYIRMAEAVRRERGLDRDLAMTASEFAGRMVRAGLPAEPVRRLTRLFEQVRYGDQPGTPEEVRQATDSLQAILRACGAVL